MISGPLGNRVFRETGPWPAEYLLTAGAGESLKIFKTKYDNSLLGQILEACCKETRSSPF